MDARYTLKDMDAALELVMEGGGDEDMNFAETRTDLLQATKKLGKEDLVALAVVGSGGTHDDVATRLDCTAGAARKRILRARRRLLGAMNGEL